MRAYSTRLSLGCLLVFCSLMVACGGGSPPVRYQPLNIVSAAPPTAYVGIKYGFTFTATGGKVPYTWSVSAGSLPAGFTLDPNTGALSGTSSSPQKYSFTVQCTDSQTPTAAVATKNVVLTVSSPSPLVITTTFLSQGYVGIPYSASLTATGGVPPYNWSITAGSLPAGLTLSTAGAISGTPTAAGSSSFTAQVTDSNLTVSTKTVNLTLNVSTVGTLQITTTTLTAATTSVVYSAFLTATGGVPPYTWTLASGSLPAGLTLSQSGMISGTPTTAGTSTFTVKVTDTEPTPQTQMQQLTLTVNNPGPLTITTTTLPNATISVTYSQFLQATGGIPPYTWSVSSGTLPAGLSLSSAGVISGTPTALGTSSFTVQVKDSATTNQQTATQALTLTVASVGNSLFSGNYAFSFNGFSNGSPIFMAGSLVSDGNGNVTSGEMDVTSTTGTVNATLVPSTYSIQDNGLGQVTLNAGTTLGTFTLQVAAPASRSIVYFVLNNQKSDATGSYGSGIFLAQATSSFDVTNLNGNYVLGLSGVDSSGKRLGRIGFQTITGGAVTAGTSDVNDAGTVTNVTTPTGTYGPVDKTTGRGMVTFHDSTGDTKYVVYMLSPAYMFLLEAEDATPAPMTIGIITKQTLGNSGGNNLSGNSVMELTGISGTSPDVAISRPVFTSTGTTFAATFDENNGGVISQTGYSGGFAIDSNGRVTFTGASAIPATMYLSGTDTAFVLGTDATVKFGTLEPQNIPANFGPASIKGTYLGGSIHPALSSVTNEADLVTSDGNKNLTTVDIDTSGPTGTKTQQTTGTYTGPDTTGRTVITVNSNQYGIGYVVGLSRVAVISAGTTDTAPKIIVLQK